MQRKNITSNKEILEFICNALSCSRLIAGNEYQLQGAIDEIFNIELYEELQEQESEETETYQVALKEHVSNL